MSFYSSACQSIDLGPCFGGWPSSHHQDGEKSEIARLAGSFPPTATGMDVTEHLHNKDLDSRVFIVTGATGTLGKEGTKVLRKRGCALVFASRDVEKARRVVEEMETEDGGDEEEDEVVDCDGTNTNEVTGCETNADAAVTQREEEQNITFHKED